MRLKNVERGAIGDTLMYQFIRMMAGYRAPDVMRTLRYRPSFFGAAHAAHTQAAMRGASAWSVGEREIFAAFVSRLNKCHF